MRFEALKISDAFLVHPSPVVDERGWFARVYCRTTFAANGLPSAFTQHSVSHNAHPGTLRGLHFQKYPHGETKLIRCTRGAVFDVVVDLRQGSKTFSAWQGVTLTPENGLMLLIPPGCAHGFQTIQPDTDLHYLITPDYEPSAARGIKFDDPSIGVNWPLAPTSVSIRDRELPDLKTVDLGDLYAIGQTDAKPRP